MLKINSRTWFVSDLHFDHEHVLDFQNNRPWASLEEMNEALIESINNYVRRDDTLVHLGDFSFGGRHSVLKFGGQLKVLRKYAIVGNHDHPKHLNQVFSEVDFYAECGYGARKFILCHYPILHWNARRHGSIHLHGHTHGAVHDWWRKKFPKARILDVGIDNLSRNDILGEFRPIHIDEVISLFPKDGKDDDHHEVIE